MSEDIKIQGGWDFSDNSKKIDKNSYSEGGTIKDKTLASLNFGSGVIFNKDGKSALKVTDGINRDEAEYIVTELEDFLDDGVLTDSEIKEYLTKKGWKDTSDSGKKAGEGYTLDNAVKSLHNIFDEVNKTFGENTQKLNTEKPCLEKVDDNTYQVKVQTWGSNAEEGNQYANDCLDRIMRNYYENITPYSEEWNTLQKQIMDLNPEIYGTADKLARNTLYGSRESSALYDTDVVKLPVNKNETEKAAEEEAKNQEKLENDRKDFISGLDKEKYDIDKINKYVSNHPDVTLAELKKEVEKDEYKIEKPKEEPEPVNETPDTNELTTEKMEDSIASLKENETYSSYFIDQVWKDFNKQVKNSKEPLTAEQRNSLLQEFQNKIDEYTKKVDSYTNIQDPNSSEYNKDVAEFAKRLDLNLADIYKNGIPYDGTLDSTVVDKYIEVGSNIDKLTDTYKEKYDLLSKKLNSIPESDKVQYNIKPDKLLKEFKGRIEYFTDDYAHGVINPLNAISNFDIYNDLKSEVDKMQSYISNIDSKKYGEL